MKYFSNSATRITTVRKQGHYPSGRVATFLAKRFASLLEREEYTDQIAAMLRGNQEGWAFCTKRLTPAEYEILFNFGVWWAIEPGSTLIEDRKAFVAVDLNHGRVLVVADRN